MLVRSLTFAALLVATGPLYAAVNNADPMPLEQDLARARPLIIIAPSTADPTLRGLQEALKDPATKAQFDERGLVLYSVAGMVGKREDKNLEQQTTMALIRELKLGARKGTQVVLVGKDGQMHLIEHDGSVEPKQIFDAVDALPAEEKAIQPPTVAAQSAAQGSSEAKPEKNGKPAKPAKPAPPPKPPKPLED